jgi:hypothetical protein
MALSSTQLRVIGVELGQEQALASNKPDLIALVTAVDDWCDTNASSYNTAIPQPFRTNLTTQQKARLLAIVAVARVGA